MVRVWECRLTSRSKSPTDKPGCDPGFRDLSLPVCLLAWKQVKMTQTPPPPPGCINSPTPSPTCPCLLSPNPISWQAISQHDCSLCVSLLFLTTVNIILLAGSFKKKKKRPGFITKWTLLPECVHGRGRLWGTPRAFLPTVLWDWKY